MLSSKQKKCIELMASGEFTQKEIAKQINITEKTICTWKKEKEFMGELDALIRISIQSLAAKAFMTQVNLLKAKSEMVRYMVSKDILDRAGYKPDDKFKVEGAIPVVIQDDMDETDD